MIDSTLLISDELENIFLPDKRLKERCYSMLEKLYKSPEKTLPSTFGGRSELKAAYRFFDQDCVTPEIILAPHIAKTLNRINQHPTVLLINDTTDINMSHMGKIQDLGVLNDINSPGCLLHVLKAFTPDRLPLGVLSAQFIQRPIEKFGTHVNKHTDSIEKKESFRWLEDYRKACDVAKNSSSEVIYIADREADLYELFYEATKDADNADIIIRVSRDRTILQENGISSSLYDALKNSISLGELEFYIPTINGKKRKNRQKRDQKGRQGRKVKQEIKSLELTLLPSRYKKKNYSPVKMYALYVEEVNCPKDEEPITWLLFTTLKITTKEDAEKIVNFYLSRWAVETFFHVLKNGCKIEELQFQASSRLLPCIAMYLIIAWRLLYTTMLGRHLPKVSCALVFEEDEWECAYAITKKKKPPLDPPSLEEMINMVAMMGGYLGRKNDGPPGPKAMWIGLQKLYFNTEGWSAHKAFMSN